MSSINKQQPISIVMTVWNRPEMTKRSIESIHNNTHSPYRLIVIDNGSEGELPLWLFAAADIYVKLDKNYGLEHAKHLGMNFVESELFISTDNDILAPKPKNGKDWLQELVDLMKKYPDYGALTCRPQVLVGTGNIFKEGDITEFDHVPSYLRIMRTQAARDTGAWSDDRTPLRGHEEYWISQRLNDNGWRTGWANNVRCFHMFGENDDWGYTGMKPSDHGHNETSLPKDSQFDLSEFE